MRGRERRVDNDASPPNESGILNCMSDPVRYAVATPWSRSADELYVSLSSGSSGLTAEAAQERLKTFGPNEFRRRGRANALVLFARQLANPLIFVLLAASALTIFLREAAETAVILLAVFVNTFLGFYQEHKAENTLEKLTAYIKDRARVIRDGEEREIDSADLVPGDLIRLASGGRVPADARLVEVNNFAADESFLTGESLSIRKELEAVSEGAPVTDRTNMVFAGSLIVEGYATAIVTATGERSEIGRIARLVSLSRASLTPLQRSVRGLAWTVFAGVSVIVAGLFFLGLSRGEPVFEMMLLSVATAVGAVPEALPIALTVILAIGVERIAARRGIMRSLAAAETLGSTTVVMTDKTGTLTQAKMQVTGILTKRKLIEGRDAEGDAHPHILADAAITVDVVVENPSEPVKDWRFIGRPLETNIAAAARDAGVDIMTLVHERRDALLPFNSTNKFSVARDKKSGRIVALGAPDVLLKRSKLTKDEYVAIEARIQEISAEGKRLVGLARVPEGDEHVHADYAAIDGLEFAGVIVLYDPIRPEAADAVRRIEAHGARVVMLTGDLKGTAAAIAREIGWEITDANMITGEEIRQISDAALRDMLPNVRIFARVTPEDKLRIGTLYQARGEIVAMTGDGVNDAPSLKVVDIGVALGSGSDVAKSVADLVLLDDNFDTIVCAIEEGRRIIANIRKAFVYLMSNCLDAVFLIGGSLIMGLPLPLNAIQIIWVNFFTGSLPALSYAFEENRDVGKGQTRGSIFNSEVQILTLGIGILTSALLFAFFWGLMWYGVSLEIARTILFLCFASYILAVAFSFKSLHRSIFDYNPFDNMWLNLSVLAAFLLVILSAAVPLVQTMLGLAPLPLPWLLVVVAWLIFNVAIVEFAKWCFRTLLHA